MSFARAVPSILLAGRYIGQSLPKVWLVPALSIALLVVVALQTEQMFESISRARVVIAALLCVAISAAVWSATRRLLLATYIGMSWVLGLGLLSKAKFAYTGATLHAFDLKFYAASPVELMFFLQHQPLIATGGLLAIGIWGAMAVLLWRREIPGKGYRSAAIALSLACLLAAVRLASSAPLQFQMLHGHFYDGYHLTSWFTSALNPVTNEALKANFPGVAPSERLASAVAAPPKKPPNIILILHESTIDPRRYQPAERARFKEDPFVSGDGATRKLIVETFGGRTWISEYGAMFGLSTHYFSPNQTFLGYLLEGKMRHSLAHALGQQGYGSTYVYPAPRAFTNTGPFYKTLGFERVVDYHDRRKPSYNKRDREHFDYVVRDLKARREARDTRPVLSFVMTEATHFPWSDAYFPDVRTDEIRPGEPWSEYARRIRIAHDDLTALKAELARSFPDEQFLLVGFGDHHPTLTAPLIADTSPTTSERYETFYRVEGINFTPSYEAAPASIEIGYLANVIMAAAGLPLDDSFRLRQRTMTACGGLMYRCKDQDAIIAMHRRLVERGDIIPRYTMAK